MCCLLLRSVCCLALHSACLWCPADKPVGLKKDLGERRPSPLVTTGRLVQSGSVTLAVEMLPYENKTNRAYTE